MDSRSTNGEESIDCHELVVWLSDFKVDSMCSQKLAHIWKALYQILNFCVLF